MSETRRRVVLGVVALLLAACGGNDDGVEGGDASPPADDSTTTSAVVAPVDGAEPAPPSGSPPTSVSGASPTTTTASRTGPPTTAGGQAAAARPGPAATYRYDTSGQATISSGASQTSSFPAVTTLRVSPASGAGQRMTRDLRDGNGNGVVVESDFLYDADGIHLGYLRQTVQQSGLSDVREFRPSPAPMFLPTGASAGQTFTYRLTGSGVTADVTVKVVGEEPVAVAGSSIPAIHLRIDTTFSGQVQGSSQADTWMRRSDGLLLKEHQVTDATTGLNNYKADYSAVIDKAP